jgi:DegV family protein with EDD domain
MGGQCGHRKTALERFRSTLVTAMEFSGETKMVKIIADTTSCLKPEFALAHDIPVIPQVINIGDESYLEGVQIDIDTFMRRLCTSAVLPKTAAPPPELFVKEFERLVPLGDPILCIMPSAEVSGTVRSAQVAAMEFPGADIRIIDTRLIASPVATIIEIAAGMAESGQPVDAIVSEVEDLSRRGRLYFMVDTLEYLARGGRIGNAAALLGTVLQIKPILRVHDGKVDQYDRERTKNRANHRLQKIVLGQCPAGGPGYLSILYSGEPGPGQAIAAELSAQIDQPEVPLYHVPPAIVTHGGPGILGVAFFVAQDS